MNSFTFARTTTVSLFVDFLLFSVGYFFFIIYKAVLVVFSSQKITTQIESRGPSVWVKMFCFLRQTY